MLLRHVARSVPIVRARQPLVAPLQRRTFATDQDAAYSQAPYKKAENVGAQPFSQFDLGGKVFVVTGAARHFLSVVIATAITLRLELT